MMFILLFLLFSTPVIAQEVTTLENGKYLVSDGNESYVYSKEQLEAMVQSEMVRINNSQDRLNKYKTCLDKINKQDYSTMKLEKVNADRVNWTSEDLITEQTTP